MTKYEKFLYYVLNEMIDNTIVSDNRLDSGHHINLIFNFPIDDSGYIYPAEYCFGVDVINDHIGLVNDYRVMVSFQKFIVEKYGIIDRKDKRNICDAYVKVIEEKLMNIYV